MTVNTKTTWPIPSAVPKLAAPRARPSNVARAKAPTAIPMSVSVAMQIG